MIRAARTYPIPCPQHLGLADGMLGCGRGVALRTSRPVKMKADWIAFFCILLLSIGCKPVTNIGNNENCFSKANNRADSLGESEVNDRITMTDSFIDPRDGQFYKTVQIAQQNWMAENLNYAIDSSWCYNNDPSNCIIYGRLYQWYSAKDLCPLGWKLPSEEEFVILLQNLCKDGVSEFHKLKEGGTLGFNALFGGSCTPGIDEFSDINSFGCYWSRTPDGNRGARTFIIGNDTQEISISSEYHWAGYSVRCLKE